MEDKLNIEMLVEEENTLEQVLQGVFEVSNEIPPVKIQGLLPPPTTREEMHPSPFRKTFKHFQRVELDGLLNIECSKVADEKKLQKGREVG